MSIRKVVMTINHMRIPVVQPTYEFNELQNNMTANVINFGAMSVKGKRALKTFSYSSFYPKEYDSSYCQFRNLKKPMAFVNSILRKKEAGETVRLHFPKYGIDSDWVIDSFKWHSDDSTEDIYYSISLSEHRLPSTPYTKYTYSIYNIEYRRDRNEVTINTYITVPGDTIVSVAAKVGTNPMELYTYNQAVLSPYLSPTLELPVGLTLAIPEIRSK